MSEAKTNSWSEDTITPNRYNHARVMPDAEEPILYLALTKDQAETAVAHLECGYYDQISWVDLLEEANAYKQLRNQLENNNGVPTVTSGADQADPEGRGTRRIIIEAADNPTHTVGDLWFKDDDNPFMWEETNNFIGWKRTTGWFGR